MLDAELASKEINPMTGLPFANRKALQAPMNSLLSINDSQASIPNTTQQSDLDFAYEFNFDENGVLFYLGSAGKRRPYQNPLILGQV